LGTVEQGNGGMHPHVPRPSRVSWPLCTVRMQLQLRGRLKIQPRCEIGSGRGTHMHDWEFESCSSAASASRVRVTSAPPVKGLEMPRGPGASPPRRRTWRVCPQVRCDRRARIRGGSQAPRFIVTRPFSTVPKHPTQKIWYAIRSESLAEGVASVSHDRHRGPAALGTQVSLAAGLAFCAHSSPTPFSLLRSTHGPSPRATMLHELDPHTRTTSPSKRATSVGCAGPDCGFPLGRLTSMVRRVGASSKALRFFRTANGLCGCYTKQSISSKSKRGLRAE